MNIATWNYRGLGEADSLKVPYVSSFVRSFGVDIMFLMETLVFVQCAVQKLPLLGFDVFCGSDALSLSGGLVVFWFSQVVVEPISVSPHVIFCQVIVPGQEIKHIIFVYGSPHISFRNAVRAEITNILRIAPNVVLFGDFNQVEYLSDKVGGSLAIPGRHEFLDWKLSSGLLDIPFSGPSFTWTNGQLGNPIFERLDKGYATRAWMDTHP
ncbi:uncharacterized protein LOC110684751 [Chenopodium quinoa]|uniref:uncharacterized protein LOC110684751 n=1 Tax=Chenopodium quinoa TaxID=63459 RepID=UPI000B786488|nr:uncharacterized protein LOC110684751 [Chenopodium quinoa]